MEKNFDYTEKAYREAVAKLKFLLSETYSQPAEVIYSHTHHHHHSSSPFSSSPRSKFDSNALSIPSGPIVRHPSDSSLANVQPPPSEFLSYIQRQEEYIQQLEKEKTYCQEEMSNLMNKVKEVLAENEALHKNQRLASQALSSSETSDSETSSENINKNKPKRSKSKERSHSATSGPNIVLESKISELEAQLTQTKIDLKKAQEEASELKTRIAESEPSNYASFNFSSSENSDTNLKKQVETLQREKEDLKEALMKLQLVVNHLKEANMLQKVKSLDVVDQAQFEKSQAELEVRRLMSELERAHEKQRESMQEQSRLRQDAERRYNIQAEKLTTDLQEQWDHCGKLSLELDRQRRLENELRRELAQKVSFIDELKKELSSKTCNLQSEALSANAEKESMEQELATAKLSAERTDRANKQEIQRLQAEVTSLRQRLDRADADLLHSRKENLRLNDQIAGLEKELNMIKLESMDRDTGIDSKHNEELTTMIMNMDAKHLQNVAELESMIETQTQLMDKLKGECHTLTQKLEETSARHKQDEVDFNKFNNGLIDRLNHVWSNCNELRRLCKVQEVISHPQMNKWSESMEEQTMGWMNSAMKNENLTSEESLFNNYSISDDDGCS